MLGSLVAIRTFTQSSLVKIGIALTLLGAICAGASSAAPAHAAAGHASRPLGGVFQGECAIGTPALADMYVGNTDYLFIAWVGCDSGNHLNIEGSTTGYNNWGNCGSWVCTKYTFWSESALYGAGPTLANWNGTLYVGWVGTDTHLNVGQYNWTSNVQNKQWLWDTSNNTPALSAHYSFGTYKLYLAWTGTDSHLNYEYTPDGITFTGKVTGDDTASAGLGLSDWSNGPAGWQLYVAWMATDSAGSLCLGYIQQGYSWLGNHNCNVQDCNYSPCLHITTTGDVGLAAYGSKLFLGYHGNGDFLASNGACGAPCDAVRIVSTTDGLSNYSFFTTANVLTFFQTWGTALAVHYPNVFDTWTTAGPGGNHWYIGEQLNAI
jgi:hypothetical protein